jgi:hypothetical protein
VLIFLAVQLWHGRRRVLGISNNKAGLFFLWRLSDLVLCRGIRRSSATFSAKPSK